MNNSLITYTKANVEVTRQYIKLYVELIYRLYGYTNLGFYIKIGIHNADYYVKYGSD